MGRAVTLASHRLLAADELIAATRVQRTEAVDDPQVEALALAVSANLPVLLWGDGLPAEEIATWAGTLSYELFCGLTQRVHFRHIGGPT